ncbi:MAG: hypothetical protein C0392_12570 [Syntrophus sp. (in: bacteria)]|nr:hypothetical protein [Syntrophus sp. (in: bacteria)]
MLQHEIVVTREELYNQVWSEPMTKLSLKYGLSDVGLAKICKKLNIPRPPRGYWAQKMAGQKISNMPLPNGPNENVRIIVDRRRISQRDRVRETVAVARKKMMFGKIPVPEHLTDPHPLVVKTALALESAKVTDTGILSPTRQCLDIRVSLDKLPRALRIMDAVVKALNAAGYDVSLANGKTRVRIEDIFIEIALVEKLIRTRLKAKDHNLKGYYRFGYNLYSDNPAPSGRLYLSIEDEALAALRLNWREAESRRLEDCIASFVSGIVKTAAVKRNALSKNHQDPQGDS